MCLKCIVVAAGEIDGIEKNDLQEYLGGFVIAADGGYTNACKLGLAVDLLVGDMDSFEGPLPQNIATVTHPTRKDSTDTQLALKLALEKGCGDIAIVGALGGRQDHAFANIQLLKYIKNHGASGQIFHAGGVITLIQNESITLPKEPYRGFSIYSFGEVAEGVGITGASYPLCDAVIKNCDTIGTSNIIVAAHAEVSVKNGSLLVFRYKI